MSTRSKHRNPNETVRVIATRSHLPATGTGVKRSGQAYEVTRARGEELEARGMARIMMSTKTVAPSEVKPAPEPEVPEAAPRDTTYNSEASSPRTSKKKRHKKRARS